MQQSKKGYRFFANTAKISVHPKDMHPNGPLLCTLVSSTAFTLQDAIRYSNLLLFSNAIHIYSVYAYMIPIRYRKRISCLTSKYKAACSLCFPFTDGCLFMPGDFHPSFYKRRAQLITHTPAGLCQILLEKSPNPFELSHDRSKLSESLHFLFL